MRSVLADTDSGRLKLCFGSKKLWRRQSHLEANGYTNHQEWLADWRDARSNEFFVLGSRDETAGCQLCVASVADDGSLTLRVRMPDCLAQEYGKYVMIKNVRFAYGHEQALAALQSNADYKDCRRQQGEKAARSTDLGQAISYRFKRDARGWRVFATTRMMKASVVTDRSQGAIGVDLNADHLAVTETDRSGNFFNTFSVPLFRFPHNTRVTLRRVDIQHRLRFRMPAHSQRCRSTWLELCCSPITRAGFTAEASPPPAPSRHGASPHCLQGGSTGFAG